MSALGRISAGRRTLKRDADRGEPKQAVYTEREWKPSRLPLEWAPRADDPFGPRGWRAPPWPRNASNAKLAAILAADVAGYSRLMGADEEGTLARLKAHRRELIDPEIGEHKGRIVKTTGDGLLVEFASVVDAVRCAVAVQRQMAERNNAVPADRRIEFRVVS